MNNPSRIRRFFVGVGITAAASTIIGVGASTMGHPHLDSNGNGTSTHAHHTLAHTEHSGGRLHHHVPAEN